MVGTRIINGYEIRDYGGVWGYVSQHGRSYGYITCPFCGADTRAYIWSLSGGGKKCNGCKAIHGSIGSTLDTLTKKQRKELKNAKR